jgi:hypothetical protein
MTLTHTELCRLSRVFLGGANLWTDEDRRINDFLKGLIAEAYDRERAAARTSRRPQSMCPHCGWRFDSDRLSGGLVPGHDFSGWSCPGSGQTPRNPESDRRPLWKDLPREDSPPAAGEGR